MRDRWQLQEAKQRFSELIRSVEADGPRFVTRHGEEVAVVVGIAEYRHLREGGRDFKEFLSRRPTSNWKSIARPCLRGVSTWVNCELPARHQRGVGDP